MHVILTGATGLVGSGVLDAMLKAQDITRITLLTRRPVQMATDRADPRVNTIIHSDFNAYPPELLSQLQDAKGVVWALGISQTKVSKEDYVTITKDYAVSAAKAFSTLGNEKDPFRFVYVSGEGATQEPGRFSAIFARVKGETEKILGEMATPAFKVVSARPAFVDSAQHKEILPYVPDPALSEKAMRLMLGGGIRMFYTSMHSPTGPLGRFFTEMVTGKLDAKIEGDGSYRLGNGWVVGNVGIRRMMGL